MKQCSKHGLYFDEGYEIGCSECIKHSPKPKGNNKMKTLDSATILDVVQTLVATNGSTTTLDTKNELRARGYWATQSVISRTLDGLYEDDVLERTQNPSGYWMYSMANTTTPVQDDSLVTDGYKLSPSDSLLSTAQNDDDVVDAMINSPGSQMPVDTRDWEAYDARNWATTMRVPNPTGALTRGKVRMMFSKAHNIPYNLTRAHHPDN